MGPSVGFPWGEGRSMFGWLIYEGKPLKNREAGALRGLGHPCCVLRHVRDIQFLGFAGSSKAPFPVVLNQPPKKTSSVGPSVSHPLGFASFFQAMIEKPYAKERAPTGYHMLFRPPHLVQVHRLGKAVRGDQFTCCPS